MRDYLYLGPTPAEEDCEQLGPNYDPGKARLECGAYIAQLVRQFGEPPEGAWFKIKGESHDFGRYYEATISFDDTIPATVEYAFHVEANSPARWDDASKKLLGLE